MVKYPPIKDEQIDNWLSGAFEGGSNYWCIGIKVKNGDYKGTKYASDCVSKGGIIIATTSDDNLEYEDLLTNIKSKFDIETKLISELLIILLLEFY
jgi:hypothetical protein